MEAYKEIPINLEDLFDKELAKTEKMYKGYFEDLYKNYDEDHLAHQLITIAIQAGRLQVIAEIESLLLDDDLLIEKYNRAEELFLLDAIRVGQSMGLKDKKGVEINQ